jgi:hypothetical protein
MASISTIHAMSEEAPVTATLGATTSSAELVLGAGSLWGFVATTDMHIRVGPTGLGAATAAYFRIPANILFTLELNRNHPSIRIFNPTAGNGVYHLVKLFRT